MAIKITEEAIKEIKAVMSEQNFGLDEYALEVGVLGGGCSGFKYKLEFKKKEEINPEKEISMEFDGVETVVNKRALLYLEGVTVDYHNGINKRGFIFDNPQSKATCGCGSSFSA